MKLGVNIDHVATVRQVRGTSYPDPLAAAHACATGGADSITVHLREDRRHIQDADVIRLCAGSPLPINLEMADAPDVLRIALELHPAEVCLVPEKRQELTTEGGLDLTTDLETYRRIVRQLQENGSEVSLFINPNPDSVLAARDTGARVVELHTGSFCDAIDPDQRAAHLERLRESAELAGQIGLQVNAGHGINLETLPDILTLPNLDTLNIGHSIVARSIFIGLEESVREMVRAIQGVTSQDREAVS